jgi:hypothetical protein
MKIVRLKEKVRQIYKNKKNQIKKLTDLINFQMFKLNKWVKV